MRWEKPETIIQHLGEEEHLLGAVVPPIFQNSLFTFESADEFEASFQQSSPTKTYNYSRIANPTVDIAEKKIAALEKCEACKLFNSGMAAISSAIFSCIRCNDHIVAVDTCYGPTKSFLSEYLTKFGVETTFVDGSDTEVLFASVRENTKVIYLESPSSILFRLQDFEAITARAKALGISTIADNSYSSPIFQNPAALGVDLVVHSATKYIAGHSDVIAGVVAGTYDRIGALVSQEVQYFGSILAPFPAWLLLRGLRTLPLRMKAHESTGNRLARSIVGHLKLEEIFHVGLEDFPQSPLRDRQMRGTGGLFSFIPKCQHKDALKRFAEKFQIFQMGVSWGGFESLVVPLPYRALDWPSERWVIRLFCGLENPDDLEQDLHQALEFLPSQ